VAQRHPRPSRGPTVKRRLKVKDAPRTVICISDPHAGCQLGLYPVGHEVRLTHGGIYQPSALQVKLWAMWREFWDEWVPWFTKREPFILVLNGDLVEGVHHGATSQVTHDVERQRGIAVALLKPVCERAATVYATRGTPAHAGPDACDDEAVAKALGAIPDEKGNHARFELWLKLHGHLGHFNHHIGTTGSSAYESTAVYKELVEAFVEAGRWGDEPPQFIVRSHRHRAFEVRVPTQHGHGIALVTPGWQLKTPFAYKVAGARVSQPQIGGIGIRAGDHILYTDSRVWRIERARAEVYGG